MKFNLTWSDGPAVFGNTAFVTSCCMIIWFGIKLYESAVLTVSNIYCAFYIQLSYIMHQSFASMLPLEPGIAGIFHFLFRNQGNVYIYILCVYDKSSDKTPHKSWQVAWHAI